MAREYDVRLRQSAVVRRGRLRESLLWGRSRRQLATADNLQRFAISVVVAAVVGAGCVGWSFLQHVLPDQQTVIGRVTQ